MKELRIITLARLSVLLLLVSLAGTAATAGLDTQTFKFTGPGEWSSTAVIMNFTGVGNIYAGRYKADIGPRTGVNIFCVDFRHQINANETYATLLHPGLVTSAARPVTAVDGEYFYAAGAPGAMVGGGIASAMNPSDYNPQNLGLLSVSQRASAVAWLGDSALEAVLPGKAHYGAVQAVIWDLLVDGGDGLGAGHVKADRAAQNADGKQAWDLFSGYLGLALQNTSYTSQTVYWVQDGSASLSGDRSSRGAHRQDFIYHDAPPVPEPQSVALAGLGLSSLAGLRFRGGRKRRLLSRRQG